MRMRLRISVLLRLRMLVRRRRRISSRSVSSSASNKAYDVQDEFVISIESYPCFVPNKEAKRIDK